MTEVKPLSEAESPEEFKTLREAARKATAEVAEKPTQTEEVTPAETPSSDEKPVTQEEPAEAKSVDDQIKELRSKGKHAAANKMMVEAATKAEKERADKLEKELEALRSRPVPEARKPSEAKPAAEAKQPTANDDNEPSAEDAKYEGASGYAKYLRDCAAWDRRQERKAEKKAEQEENEKRERGAVIRDKIKAGRTKYADFDTVTYGDPATNTGLILTPAMQQFFMDHPDGSEVVYQLGKDPAEAKRIAALSPTMQWGELGYLAKLITTPAKSEPEAKKPAVSRVTAPPRTLSGADTPEPKSTAEARDFDEFKRLRKASRAS